MFFSHMRNIYSYTDKYISEFHIYTFCLSLLFDFLSLLEPCSQCGLVCNTGEGLLQWLPPDCSDVELLPLPEVAAASLITGGRCVSCGLAAASVQFEHCSFVT